MNRLHIISFDIPYPPNYGGAIDVYYKLKALHEAGISVHLHCFQYGDRQISGALQKVCTRVSYYPRNRAWWRQLSLKPFIVGTRLHPGMLRNLLADDAPILFEGLHTCGYIGHPSLRDRLKIVRVHNIEADYYRALTRSETSLPYRAYLAIESLRLRLFERSFLRQAGLLLPLSTRDAEALTQFGLGERTRVLPVFHEDAATDLPEGIGDGVLFHGNLGVADNARAALLLAQQTQHQGFTLTIAGSNPSPDLRNTLVAMPHIRLVADPSPDHMRRLIADAQVHLLWSFQASGVKLKLLHALARGRHIVCNSLMTDGSGLDSLCHLVSRPDHIAAAVAPLLQKPLASADFRARTDALGTRYSNAANADILVRLLHP